MVTKYYSPDDEKEIRSDLVTKCIKHVIATANTKEGKQKQLGLSKSQINSHNNLYKIIESYQDKKKHLRVKSVDISVREHFLNWLINSEIYSESYSRKKVVCNDAKIDGIETSLHLLKVKGENTENENVIYLKHNEL
jgi:hypothetical protein